MRASRWISTLLILLPACNTAPTDTGPLPAAAIEIVSGDDQSQLAGFPLADPVTIRVVDELGRPVPDVEVAATTTGPAGEVQAASYTTGADGTVTMTWRLAAALGTQELSVMVDASGGPYHAAVHATGTGSAVRAISGASSAACAVYLDGRMGCFEVDQDPPLVFPTVELVDGPMRFTDVAVAEQYTQYFGGCAIAEGGRVWCFDLDWRTQLTTNWREVPGGYASMQRLRGVAAVSDYGGTFCGLDAEASLWCWGRNESGVLGDGTEVSSLAAIRVPLDFPVSGFTVGVRHACATETDGTAWCWGANYTGPLGRPAGSPQFVPQPMQTELRFGTMMAFGVGGTCGVGQSTTYCWGTALPDEIWNTVPTGERHIPRLIVGGTISLATSSEAVFVVQGGGTGTQWGHFSLLHQPREQWTRRPTRYPIPFSEVLQNVPNDMFCGRQGASEQVLCYIAQMFTWYPSFLVDPPRMVGFGVPFPPL